MSCFDKADGHLLERHNADVGALSASDSEARDSQGATATLKPSQQPVKSELF